MIVNKHNRVLGLMSGTSLDGLDLCLVCFGEDENDIYTYSVYAAETISYPDEWREKLLSAEHADGNALMELHNAYGKFLGESVAKFLAQVPKARQPGYVSSHGHTIFHRPDLGYTFQLGSGASLAAACALPVVCDFRSSDVALGGQGAPLVPIGDKLLFGEFEECLNLGGFANISFEEKEKRLAYDICPVNYVLNYLAQREGMSYDVDGRLSASGKILRPLLTDLNSLDYYKQPYPKSAGREWVEKEIFPLLSTDYNTRDLLATFTDHVVNQVSRNTGSKGRLLVTGGGAHNSYLIRQLKRACALQIVLPDQTTMDFKEAIIFAFLGWLRWRNKVNVLSSVTGARKDSSAGAIYWAG
jgi:anhydro-N-acetylmuramic acid kinase